MAKQTHKSAATLRLEHARARRRFAIKMAIAIGIWIGLTLFGLTIGMAGYAFFEGMNFIDAYVNAAMILSGMGPLGELKSARAKSSPAPTRSFQAC